MSRTTIKGPSELIVVRLGPDAGTRVLSGRAGSSKPADFSEAGTVPGYLMSFRRWVVVTHETKEAVLSKVPPETFRELRAKNPDIWVVGRGDDRVVLTPPQTRRKSGEARRSKIVTDVHAREVLGDDWPSKVPILKFCTRYEAALSIVAMDPLRYRLLHRAIRQGRILSVVYIPSVPCLIIRPRSARQLSEQLA